MKFQKKNEGEERSLAYKEVRMMMMMILLLLIKTKIKESRPAGKIFSQY